MGEIFKTPDADPTCDYTMEDHHVTLTSGNDETVIWEHDYKDGINVQVSHRGDVSPKTVSSEANTTSGVISTGASQTVEVDVLVLGK